jgi:hypothetical protein
VRYRDIVTAAFGAVTLLAAVWLIGAVVHAGREPRRDAAAARRLALLRDGATTPGCVLLQIAATIWSGPAGQRALGIDVATGLAHDMWFAEAHHEVGSFVLARVDGYLAHAIDTAPAALVQAAHRHQHRQPAVDDTAVTNAAERLLRSR